MAADIPVACGASVRAAVAAGMEVVMRVFVCTDHDLHYPVGCASVVVAHDEAEARQLLDTALVKRGLQPSTAEPYTLKPLDTNRPAAVILRDGEY